MKAVAAELQTQVDDLNDERVRLLKKLRDGAGASGVGSARGGEEREGDREEGRDVSRLTEKFELGDTRTAQAGSCGAFVDLRCQSSRGRGLCPIVICATR